MYIYFFTHIFSRTLIRVSLDISSKSLTLTLLPRSSLQYVQHTYTHFCRLSHARRFVQISRPSNERNGLSKIGLTKNSKSYRRRRETER